jgi:CHAD domain-containing protein
MTQTFDGPRSVPPPSKWIPGVSPEQPVREAAAHILDIRLKAVGYWLPLAAEKSAEDAENVHQLRIASRRAVEAVRLFSDLVEGQELADLRGKLRQIRRAADGARNWDVLSPRFVSREGIAQKIWEEVRKRRAEAQGPIVSIHQELLAGAFDQQIDHVVRAVATQALKKIPRSFGRQAPRYLKKALRRFFRAAVADLSDDENLHELRILAKKLRYTMEPLSSAFDADFRNRLYPQITFLQDLLGSINDHAMARTLFGEWHQKTNIPEERAFLAGLLAAEERAHDDLRQTFLAFWTPDTVVKLRRQFRKYCSADVKFRK